MLMAEPEEITVNVEIEQSDIGPIPEVFYWNVAFDLMASRGAEETTVLALSMISEQLDYIARRLTHG